MSNKMINMQRDLMDNYKREWLTGVEARMVFEEVQHLEKENEELKADIRFLRSELRIADDTASLLVKMLASQEGLLREALRSVHVDAGKCESSSMYHELVSLGERIEAALSASEESKCCAPTAEELKLLADGDYTPEELWGVGGKPSCSDCHKTKPSTPVERDERAEFERNYAEEFSRFRDQTVSAEDIATMRDASGGYGERAYLNGQWKGWQARAALDKTTEGASHE